MEHRSTINANKAITTYDKAYIEGTLKDAVADNRMLFVDKKRSHLIVRGEEVQFLNSLYENDFKNSIANFWANVNYSQQIRLSNRMCG